MVSDVKNSGFIERIRAIALPLHSAVGQFLFDFCVAFADDPIRPVVGSVGQLVGLVGLGQTTAAAVPALLLVRGLPVVDEQVSALPGPGNPGAPAGIS